MSNLNIKGKYQINILFTRMFKQYKVPLIKKSNLITNNGIKFFTERIAGLTNDSIYEICLGKINENTRKVSKNDTELFNEIDQVAPAIGIEDNKIVLQSTILTDDMEDICEIGVKTEGTTDNNYQGILISHDTFEPLTDLNITANFLLKYTFTLENTDNNINWQITEDSNIYKTPYTENPTNITNKEYTIYTECSNMETLKETPYSYYFIENTLYINSPNNPLKEDLNIII